MIIIMVKSLQFFNGDGSTSQARWRHFIKVWPEIAHPSKMATLTPGIVYVGAWIISQTFYKPMDAHSVTNVLGERISSISMWNIVNQLGKHHFLVDRFFLWVGSKWLKKFFFQSVNRNWLHLTLVRHDRSCLTMEKLGCLNSTVNETF